MELTSDAFASGERLPRKHTCDGENVSPPLRWSGAPEGTESFAVICEDPDAPAGIFDHWGIYDISADTTELPEAVAVDDYPTVENDFAAPGYRGACPPRGHGVHAYHFRVYALDRARLDVARDATVDDLRDAAQRAAIDTAEIIGRYERG